MSFRHVLYPIYSDDRGVVYQCGTCDRKIVILTNGQKVEITEGKSNIEHEMVTPIEKTELPPEFEALFSEKGWE